jgi:anti-anti-sigma factor
MTSRAPTVERGQVFSLDLVKEGTSVIITMSGELDMSTVGTFSDAASASLLEPSTHKLLVDLGRVTFVDCTGLGGLVDAKRRAVSEAKGFELRSVPPRVRRLLDLSGLGNYFTIGQR